MQDLRLAIRTLRATPNVSAVAILSLALGIGANTAMFSIVDALLMRTLPVKDPARLAFVSDGAALAWGSARPWSYPVWEQIRRRPELFERTMAWARARFNLAPAGPTQYVDGLWASGSFFEPLGVGALLGRTFSDADDRRGGGPDGAVAVISYDFWQRHFGGAADAIGRTLAIDRVPFTIVGVMPPGFFGPDVGSTFDVIVPFGDEPLLSGPESRLDGRNMVWIPIIVRLKPGQTIDAATAALRGVQPQIRDATIPENWPQRGRDLYMKEALRLTPAAAGNSFFRRQYQRPLLTIMVVVALVLLIACANIANLLLARATARRQELSVRVALGATSWRLARQLLVESMVLAVAGAAIGIVLASWASRLLVRQLSSEVSRVFLDLSLDGRLLAFTIGLTVLTTLAFGVAPALRASSVAPINALKEHGRASSGGGRVGLASSLVVGQVAVSLVLVVAAVLFLRTFASLANMDLGFNRDRVLVVTVNSQRADIAPEQRIPLYHRLRDAVRSVPGAANAGVSLVTPVSGMTVQNRVDISDAAPIPETERVTMVNAITPGWFATFGTPIVAGRDILDTDRKGAPGIGVVNQAFVRKFLNGASPLGHTITIGIFGPDKRSLEIVGVAADAVYRSLRDPAPPTLYMPLAQWSDAPMFLATVSLSVRTATGAPVSLTRSVAAAIGNVNPRLALTFRPLADQVNASLSQERVVALLSGFFGALALLLAGLGIYGVTAYAVSRRRTEIGIRMALGAAPGGVVRLVMMRVMLLVGLGVIVGIGGSLLAGRFVSALLFGLGPRDPITLLGAVSLLAVFGAFAGWLPAWMASRTDPAEVLRET